MAGVALLCSAAWTATSAEQLFERAQKAEKSGQRVSAYLLYAEAAAADPSNPVYWQRAQALRPTDGPVNFSQSVEAEPEPDPEPADPSLFGGVTDQDLELARKPLPPPELNAAPGRGDYDFSGDSKALWEQLASAMRLKVLFDPQYQPVRPFRFQLSDADYREALRALEAATNSFLVPISPRLIFVANDTQQKRTEYERTAAIIVPYPEALSNQELGEIATALRGLTDSRTLMIDTQHHLFFMRDKVTKVRVVQKLLDDLTRPRAQVAVEVELLTTDRASSLSYGLSLPSAFPLVNFPTKFNLLNVIPQGYSAFLRFGGGASLMGIGITSAQLFATVAKTNAQSVLQSEILARDGQAATLHVGEKYPVLTNGYFGNTTGAGQVYTPPPSFNFEDLGLSLKVTPHIHGSEEVTLEVSAAFELLTGVSSNGIPVIANTKYESNVTVRNGEWAVLAGLMTASETRSITGIPLLSAIPFLRQNSVNRDEGETLIVLKPHLLIAPPTELPTWRAWTGTETRLPTDL